MQVLRAVADGGEDARQAREIAAARQLRAGMGKGGDRRERVVQLMADDTDHTLPRVHFLARQLAGHPAIQLQPVRAPLQAEPALGKMEGFLAAIHFHGE
ncbi:MAG TPA: hypothetical protein VKD21_08145, partial [Acidimicrobiales bacterium]|nr:hypothetical protein [Acidimicrobiales bacterium]